MNVKIPRFDFVLSLFVVLALALLLPLFLGSLQEGRDRDVAKLQQKEEEELEKRLKEKMAARVFHQTFGVDLPPLGARETVQADVIKKLVEVGRRADIATQKVETIGSAWDKTPTTIKGVAKRLEIQKKYDEAEKEKKESWEEFRQTCRATRRAGFDEEARALYCP